jgi:hypothetical protein
VNKRNRNEELRGEDGLAGDLALDEPVLNMAEIIEIRKRLKTGKMGLEGAIQRLHEMTDDATRRAKWQQLFREDQQVWWDEVKRWALGNEGFKRIQ